MFEEAGILGKILMGLTALVCVCAGVRALWTGELHGRGRSVIRQADTPMAFYGTVGGLLFGAAAILDTVFGFQLLVKLLMTLVNLNL